MARWPNAQMTPVERVYARSPEDANGCLVWTGCKTGNGGYGSIYTDVGNRPTHQLTWEEVNGPLPDGLELDHTCENRLCVRPSHLDAVTHEENLRRSRERGRMKPAKKIGDLCSQEHLLCEDNVVIERRGHLVFIKCRICNNAKRRARRMVA